MLATLKLPPWTLGERGFAALSRVMSVFCYAAAGVVGLIIILALIIMMLIGHPMQKQIGTPKAGVHINSVLTNDFRRIDPACITRVTAAHGKDFTACLVRAAPSAVDTENTRHASESLTGRIYTFAPMVLWTIPMAVLTYGLCRAGRCFGRLARRAYFAPETVRALRDFAMAGLFFVVAFPLLPWIHGAITHFIFSTDIFLEHTIFKPAPGASWSFSMPLGYTPPVFAVGAQTSFSGVLTAIYAFTVAILAVVMSRASTLARDHAQII